LVRRQNGTPERLGFRFWGADLEIEGTLVFAEASITGTRTVNGRTFAEDMDIEAGTGFWFPSTVGLGLAANMHSGTAVTLNNTVGDADTLALKQIEMQVMPMITELVDIEIAGKTVKASPVEIAWDDSVRFVMLDKKGWPVEMQRDDLLTAVETRYIWY
jgi:hypothetical protein